MLRQPFDYHTAVPKQGLPILARTFTALSTISNRFATSAITEYKAGTPIPSAASGGGDGTFNIGGTGGVTLEVTTNADGAAAIAANPVGSVFALTTATVPALSGSDQVGLSGTFGGVAYAGTTTSRQLLQPVKPILLKLLQWHLPLVVATYTLASGFTAPDGDVITVAIAKRSDSTVATYVLQKLNDEIINQARTSQLTERINVYSFALKPEEHQPSGTCNFSRIDNAQLKITGNPVSSGSFSVYAVNYNVLRIMSGMGGLAYSN